jgi:hypothetical protein
MIDDVKALTHPVFCTVIGFCGELYNKDCFEGDSYWESDWQGV